MKGFLKVIIAVLGIALIIGAVSAAQSGNANGNMNLQGNSHQNVNYQGGLQGDHPGDHQGDTNEEKMQVLTLVQKDAAWAPVVGGANGTLMYRVGDDPKFVFNGTGLVPDVGYTLISYTEPWGNPVLIQGTGVADGSGNVTIKGGALKLVCNNYPTPTSNEYSGTGSKIWLVPTSDLTGALFNAWNPSGYLFETKLINTGCKV